jgi:hypothetical protein
MMLVVGDGESDGNARIDEKVGSSTAGRHREVT